jgi:hypothetical protein
MTPGATGGTSDGQVGTPLEGHRATALRLRRLVGRDAEVAEVIERLALTPLTTVTGPGGVGKTSLALTVAVAAASRFPDDVFVIWLASLRSAEHIAGEVAAQVGMPRSGGQSYEDSLARWLADRDVLLVLDNCEHVVSAVADLVEGLTGRLPRLRVLATSREPRHLADTAGLRAKVHPHMLRHTFVTTMQVSNVASSASFSGLREHVLPALQRTAPRRFQRDGAPSNASYLRCQQPVAPAARMRYLIRLQEVTACCGQGNVQERSEDSGSIRPITG